MIKEEHQKILLIDINSILYKVFHSTKKFALDGKQITLNDEGNPVNILKTFAEVLIKYKTKVFKDYKIIIAFDHPERNTFRNEYSFYKSNRKKEQDYYDIFVPQFALVEEFLKLMKIPVFQSRDLEADDIIGILSTKFSKQNHQIEVITSDKDFLQLISKNVSINLMIQGRKNLQKIYEENMNDFLIMNKSDEMLKYKITPTQVIDFKALNGDASDNIPGLLIKNYKENKIKKIDTLTSLKLIYEYGDVENIVREFVMMKEENKNTEFPDNLVKAIVSQKEKIIRNKKIATIITEWECSFEISDYRKDEYINFKQLYIFLSKNNLNHLIWLIKQKKELIVQN